MFVRRSGAPVRYELITSRAGSSHGGNGTLRKAKFRVADVSNSLMSVSEMVDAGHQVTFDESWWLRRERSCTQGAGHADGVRQTWWRLVDWNLLPFQGEGGRGKTVRSGAMLGVLPCEEDDNVADHHEELHVVNATRMPNERSADKVTAPNVTHESFRARCRACVTDRGVSSKHNVSDHEYGALAAVVFDCGFSGNEDLRPFQVGKDQMHRWFLCSCGAEQRRDTSLVGADIRAQTLAGLKRVAMRSDGDLTVNRRSWHGRRRWRPVLWDYMAWSLPKKLPNEQRGDKQLLWKTVGTPATPVPRDEAADEPLVTVRMDVALVVSARELHGPPSAPVDVGLSTRRVYL